MIQLFEPQKPHVDRLVRSIYLNGIGVDLSQTGCGKTYCAVEVAKKVNSPVVIVCPKAVIPTWKKVMYEGGVSPSVIINYEKLMRGNTPYLTYDKKAFFNKKNWESRGVKINFDKNSLIIVDEVHKCKGLHSLNSNFLIACKNAGYSMLVLSATAATNPLEMKAFGYATNLHNGVNYGKWCQSLGAEYDSRFGSMNIILGSDKARQGMMAVHDNLFNYQQIASRLTVKELESVFPQNRVYAEAFDMGSNSVKIQQVYDEMENEIARLDSRSANYKPHVFAEIVKARRKAEIYKVPTMVEMVVDLYDEGISPVVFVNYTDTMQSLIERLADYKDKIGLIYGGQGDKQRNQHIDEFQVNKRRIMLANLTAGNCGISLHDLTGDFPRHSIVSPSFSAIALLQALGRIFRAEAKSACIQKVMFAANTIEERACKRVQGKLDNLDYLNDGDLIADVKIWENIYGQY